MVTAQSWDWLGLHRHWTAGRLAVGGGMLDQPAVYVRAMEIIDEQEARRAKP